MKNKHLLAFALIALVLAGVGKRTSEPSRQVLATICEAFAYNLTEDGKRQRPRLTTAGDVGRVVDDFGKRSALGVSYRAAFADEFKELGAELAQAAGGGKDADAAPLPAQLRQEMAAILLAFAVAL